MEIIQTPLIEIRHAELTRMLQRLNRDARTLSTLERVPHLMEYFVIQGRLFFEKFIEITGDQSVTGIQWAGYEFSAEGATALAQVSDSNEGKIIAIIPDIPHADEEDSVAATV